MAAESVGTVEFEICKNCCDIGAARDERYLMSAAREVEKNDIDNYAARFVLVGVEFVLDALNVAFDFVI